MIVADQNGLFSRIVTDFGANHSVNDKNGEEAGEVMIYAIEPIANGKAKIHLPADKTHNLEEGDQVELS